MSHRKYVVLLGLTIMLVVTLFASVNSVGATVYMPPTPIPEQRFSESSDKLLAMFPQPGTIVVLGESGSSDFIKAAGITDADMDKAILARVERATTGSSYEGVKKVLAKPILRELTFKDLQVMLESYGVYLSDDMAARIQRTGEAREVLLDMLEHAMNPDMPEFRYVESDNTWFMGCLEEGACFR